MFIANVLTAVCALAHGANARWIFYAPSGMLSYGRLDPVLYPGVVSPHVHQFQGANGLQATYDFNTVRDQSICTNMMAQQDLSNYWSPAMYHYDGDTSYRLMSSNFHIYYIGDTYGYDANNVNGVDYRQAFPEGFSMIAGNLFSRFINDSDPTTYAAQFQCLRSTGDSPYSRDIRDFQAQGDKKGCDSSLRATVNFPSCWNGKDVSTPNGHDHVAYPEWGVCPKEYPIAIMELLFEFYFQVQDFPFDPTRNDNWVLSFGDTSGFGMHSDFTNGWKRSLLQDAIDECSHTSEGGTENCAAFSQWQGHQIPPCAPSGLYPNEDVGLQGSVLKALPGCNKLWKGNTTKPTCSTTPTTPPINLQLGPDMSNWNYAGCPFQYTSKGAILGEVWQTGLTNMTTDSCLATCEAGGYKWAGMTWGNNCFCDNELRNGGTVDSDLDYACFVRCGPNELEYCGGFGSMQLYEACSGDKCQWGWDNVPQSTAPASWS